MLQQTQVKTVLPYWERWMRELPDIAALARVPPEKLHKLWEGLGYYTRVRNMQRTAQLVIEQHGGRFPDDLGQLLELPGIGRYTAGAVCSIAFNQPRPILDGNVARVLSRLFGIAGNVRETATRETLWQIAGDLVLRASEEASGKGRRASDFNQSLMELGALVCAPRQPRCGDCPVAGCCVALRQDRVQELPCMGPRAPATPRRFIAFVARNRARFLVRQRPAGGVNAHLWEFPNVELGPAQACHQNDAGAVGRARSSRPGVAAPPDSLEADLQPALSPITVSLAALGALGVVPEALEPLCTIRHSITRYRITLTVYQAGGLRPHGVARAKGQWLARNELSGLAFASAHKQILRRLGLLQR